MSKKQFFLSMSKKQLISSLAVTGMMMGQMGGNVFANGNYDINTLNTISSPSDEVISSENVVIFNKVGKHEVGNKDLKVPNTAYMKIPKPNPQPTEEKNSGKKSEIMEISLSDKTNDKFKVIENITSGDSENASQRYKVEANVSDSGVDFIVTTRNGVTLGALTKNAIMDEIIKYKDIYETTVYKFHYLFDASGDHEIYINVGEAKYGSVLPGIGGAGGSSGQGTGGSESSGGNVSGGTSGGNVSGGTSGGNVSGGTSGGNVSDEPGCIAPGPNVSENVKIDSEDNLRKVLDDAKKKDKVSIELEANIDITSKKDLTIPSNVTIIGNGHTINLNGNASIVLKGKNIKISNININRGKDIGIQIYNSRNVILEKVTVENTKELSNGTTSGFGIFVNGSTVDLKDCTTQHNGKGGIYISRSTTLNTKDCIDSAVIVVGTLTQYENDRPDVVVKNLQMVNSDGTRRIQGNTFLPMEESYKDAKIEIKYEALSTTYIDKLEKQGIKINAKEKFRNETITYNEGNDGVCDWD